MGAFDNLTEVLDGALSDHLAPLELEKVTHGEYDPDTGTRPTTRTPYHGRGLIYFDPQGDVDSGDELQEQSFRQWLLLPLGFRDEFGQLVKPDVGDAVVCGGDRVEITVSRKATAPFLGMVHWGHGVLEHDKVGQPVLEDDVTVVVEDDPPGHIVREDYEEVRVTVPSATTEAEAAQLEADYDAAVPAGEGDLDTTSGTNDEAAALAAGDAARGV